MKPSFFDSVEELLLGRAYLPVYAAAAGAGNSGNLLPPPILPQRDARG